MGIRFADTDALHLPGWVPDELLEACRRRLAGARWVAQDETGQAFAFDTAGVDLPELAAHLAAEADAVKAVAGLPQDARFEGRLKRLTPGGRFPWHRDYRDGQLLGMTVNLSEEGVLGGVFEQRLRWEGEARTRIASEPGDLILFDVADPRRVHRVTAVTHGARVVWTGWWRRA